MLVTLHGRTVTVGIDDALRLTVSARDGEPLWESSRSLPPAVRVAVGAGGSRTVGLADAQERSVQSSGYGRHAGYRILLAGYADADVTIALTIALDADDDELLIGIEQAGGEHAVQRVDHLYRFERPVAQGGHLVLPHGSGYLVPADCPDALPGRGPEPIQVGGRWSLPMFGLTRDGAGLCATVDTWWDAEVRAHHLPGDRSILDFSWADELGTLAYPRRLLVHFARDLDYVAMAKRYRAQARQQGLLRTLEEKADESPRIRAYADNILFRWTEWNGADSERVLGDLRRLRELGIGANLFYPKWGGPQGRPPIQNHQAFLVDEPGDGGWGPLVEFANRARALGCITQGFIRPCEQSPGETGYDESYWAEDADGRRLDHLGTHAALDVTSAALDGLEAHGLRFDVLYFDGYAAANTPPRNFSPAHPVTRRQVFEAPERLLRRDAQAGDHPGRRAAPVLGHPALRSLLLHRLERPPAERPCGRRGGGAPAGRRADPALPARIPRLLHVRFLRRPRPGSVLRLVSEPPAPALRAAVRCAARLQLDPVAARRIPGAGRRLAEHAHDARDRVAADLERVLSLDRHVGDDRPPAAVTGRRAAAHRVRLRHRRGVRRARRALPDPRIARLRRHLADAGVALTVMDA